MVKISVVIPLFNKYPVIRDTISSVLNQTYLPIEIIVIDDGSDDEGGEYVRNLSIEEKLIKYYFQENQGPSFARNKGIKKACGDLIAFLDADDYWLSEYLDQIRKLFENFPACGAYATNFNYKISNSIIKYNHQSMLPPHPWLGILPDYFKLIQKSPPFFTSSVVISKNIFNSIGYFDEGINRGEDLLFWSKVALNYPIAYSPNPLVFYNQTATNRLSNNKENLEESKYSIFLSKKIESLSEGGKLQQNLSDFYTKIILDKAMLLVDNCLIDQANYLLNKELIRKNKKYKKKYLLLKLLIIQPIFIRKILINKRE